MATRTVMRAWLAIAAKSLKYVASASGLVLVTSCFGHTVVRNEGGSDAMVVNLGTNRYIYSVTPTVELPPASASAVPVVSIAPADMVEVGIITLRVKVGGLEYGSLRRTEAEFYPELGILASEMGGSYFHVSDKEFVAQYLTTMTVSVMAPAHKPGIGVRLGADH